MSKTYSTPELTVKGSIVELTLGQDVGDTDGDTRLAFPFGSVGFSL